MVIDALVNYNRSIESGYVSRVRAWRLAGDRA